VALRKRIIEKVIRAILTYMTALLVSYKCGVTQEGSDQLVSSESMCPEGQSRLMYLVSFSSSFSVSLSSSSFSFSLMIYRVFSFSLFSLVYKLVLYVKLLHFDVVHSRINIKPTFGKKDIVCLSICFNNIGVDW
jgi:hypothetical protein